MLKIGLKMNNLHKPVCMRSIRLRLFGVIKLSYLLLDDSELINLKLINL